MALFLVPKSPRWLIQKLSLVEAAEKTLIKIGGNEYAISTIEEIRRGIAKKENKGTFFLSNTPKIVLPHLNNKAFKIWNPSKMQQTTPNILWRHRTSDRWVEEKIQ
mgnify:CR=1 FL=1